MKRKISAVCLTCLLLLGMSACAQEAQPEETVPVISETAFPPQTEAVATTAIPETTVPEIPTLLERPVSGKVCVGFLPTETGNWRYGVIEDQEAALAAYEKATGAIYSDEWWIKGDRTMGLMVVYGDIWDFVESGELVYALGRVKAEDAADLLALCTETAAELGWKEPVTPEQLTGIVSATLRQGDTEFLLTDGESLQALEAMLTGGQYSLGGTSCPFTALLDVETQDGEVLTIALATDSCGVWMSEGYYYEYAHDSQPLFSLFGAKLDVGTLTAE